jgi:hypothetical protein
MTTKDASLSRNGQRFKSISLKRKQKAREINTFDLSHRSRSSTGNLKSTRFEKVQ